jgi:hypothetical protein
LASGARTYITCENINACWLVGTSGSCLRRFGLIVLVATSVSLWHDERLWLITGIIREGGLLEECHEFIAFCSGRASAVVPARNELLSSLEYTRDADPRLWLSRGASNAQNAL